MYNGLLRLAVIEETGIIAKGQRELPTRFLALKIKESDFAGETLEGFRRK